MTITRLYEIDKNRLRELERLVVVGDIHGDKDALSSLIKNVSFSKDGIVFLGDYADRGPYGVEVIDMVNDLLDQYPENVIALKGNHENYNKFGVPGAGPADLIDEVNRKKGDWDTYFHTELRPFLKRLYLAAIIPGEILFVHGGVSSRIKTLDDLRHPTRKVEIDVLWSDPSITYSDRFRVPQEIPNRRGLGVEFGKDITNKVCNNLGVKKIIRSHEPHKTLLGPYYEHDGKVITTSSTSAYGCNPLLLTIDLKNDFKISSYPL